MATAENDQLGRPGSIRDIVATIFHVQRSRVPPTALMAMQEPPQLSPCADIVKAIIEVPKESLTKSCPVHFPLDLTIIELVYLHMRD